MTKRGRGSSRPGRVVLLGATLALLFTGLAFAGPGDFSQPPTSPESAGNTSPGIVSADFNDDQDVDLAVANSVSKDVTILLGNGAGDFAPAAGSPEAIGGSTGPWDLVAADLDGDDDVDIATATSGDFGDTGTASILLNNGSGDFAAPLSEDLGINRQPRSIDAADMNGDDEVDLIVGNFFHATVRVLINDGEGDGDFTGLAEVDVGGSGTNLTSLAAAQIDNDTDVDVVIGHEFTDTVRVLSNANGLGALSFLGPAIPAVDPTIAIGDLGSNDFNDLALGNKTGNNVSIQIGAGDGTFTPAGTSPEAVPGGSTGNGPNAMVAEDFNGDANLDLAVAAGFNGANSRVAVLLGNGAGDFSPTAGSPINVGPNIPVGIAAGDFNGGNLDLAVSNWFPQPNSAVNVLLNDLTPPMGGGGSGDTTNPAPGPTDRRAAALKKCKKKKSAKKRKKCRKKAKRLPV